jgi:uncharacterized membrane protein (Fun14 family)
MSVILAAVLGFILGFASYYALKAVVRRLIRFGQMLEILEDLHHD